MIWLWPRIVAGIGMVWCLLCMSVGSTVALLYDWQDVKGLLLWAVLCGMVLLIVGLAGILLEWLCDDR